jgi:hypothetical protein
MGTGIYREQLTEPRGCIIEIGVELIAASEEVPHGEWERWLKEEFDWSDRTARRYVSVASAFSSDTVSADFDTLTIEANALYALAASDVPQAARDEAVERAQAGDHVVPPLPTRLWSS